MKRRRPSALERDGIILTMMSLRLPLSQAEKRRVAEAPALARVAAGMRKRMLDGAVVGDSGIIYASASNSA